MRPPLVLCPVCKDGKLTITVTGEGKTSELEINCVHCNGQGTMTWAQRDAYDRMVAMWCRCGNSSGQVTFHDDAPGSKHHWTCDDCGKVVQVG